MSTITFNELSQALASAGCPAGAAECHATLTGLICADPLGADWLAQITGGGDNLDACRDVLERLRQQLHEQLSGDLFQFDLLLPGDEVDLTERTDSLAQWCQGFLFGLTVGGLSVGDSLHGDSAEVVGDLARLSEAVHKGPASEDDERHYLEICEYVRAGTQIVFEDLSDGKK